MKKRAIVILLTTIMLGGLLSACGNTNNATPTPTATSEASQSSEASPSADADTSPGEGATPSKEPESSKAPSPATKDIVDEMLKQVEQPVLMEMSGEQVKEAYGIDMALLEDYAVHVPLMNVKTNEIAIFKVKKPTDIAAVKKGIETRAENVQKQFEQYLQDQYENAKNYKLVTKGNYVLFLISESADELEKVFNDSFNK